MRRCREPRALILPAVSPSRISPPRGGEYLYEVTAGSIRRRSGRVRASARGPPRGRTARRRSRR
ncbi:hypothetical protein BRD06_03085 [Halobacteriales archaeon QS_9_67_15]|nr:MAG: hypothetical protein BRD06_03085 [Halobacteriales archaeon QS_9_67_15]